MTDRETGRWPAPRERCRRMRERASKGKQTQGRNRLSAGRKARGTHLDSSVEKHPGVGRSKRPSARRRTVRERRNPRESRGFEQVRRSIEPTSPPSRSPPGNGGDTERRSSRNGAARAAPEPAAPPSSERTEESPTTQPAPERSGSGAVSARRHGRGGPDPEVERTRPETGCGADAGASTPGGCR